MVVESTLLMSSVAIAFHTQPLQIEDILQRIANGRLLLPNVEGLRTNQEGRAMAQLHWGQRGFYPVGKLRVF